MNLLWESYYHYGYDIDNLLVIGMPEQKFAFGFEANDASAYLITRYYSEDESEYMELQGNYNQDETFTLQQYKSRTQLTEDDFQYLDGSGGFTFPISESEWQTLRGLVNNASGVNLPIVILHN